jgi:hypothetical protein
VRAEEAAEVRGEQRGLVCMRWEVSDDGRGQQCGCPEFIAGGDAWTEMPFVFLEDLHSVPVVAWVFSFCLSASGVKRTAGWLMVW